MTVDRRITWYCKANRVEPNGVEEQTVETDPDISQSVQRAVNVDNFCIVYV